MSSISLSQGQFILYDNDCGICTKVASILRKVVSRKTNIVPMHINEIEIEGIRKIGYDAYWKSFHVVSDGEWTTELEAIYQLTTLLPLSVVVTKIAKLPFVSFILVKFLQFAQNRRKLSCKVFEQ